MAYVSNMIAGLRNDPTEFPTIILNDGSIRTIDEAANWIAANAEELIRELECTGALLFRGFPVVDTQTYDTFFGAFGYPNFTYKESLSNAVRINHTPNVFTANEAPKNVEIYLHNEMAQTPIFPRVISLFCESAAEIGGATSICRSDQIYDRLLVLEPEMTDKLERLGIRYTTVMPAEDSPISGQGRSWKSTLSVDSKEGAEQRLSSLGYRWVWNDDGSLSAQTGVLPAVKTLDDGRKVFFNQIIAAYMGWKGVRENPSQALCFGDDSDIPKSFLEAAVSVSRELVFEIEWQDQDVAVVFNHMAMHGRLPFEGERPRKVYVALGR